MNLALACVFLFMGSAMIYVGTHGLQANSPWAAYRSILSAIDKGSD